MPRGLRKKGNSVFRNESRSQYKSGVRKVAYSRLAFASHTT
jgi:hypothetical protein